MLLKFIHAGINAANHIAVRIVFAYREGFFALNRHSRDLLLENLESDTRHGLIRVPSFTLAIRAFDNLAICLLEIDIKRLIVITETQVIHREPLIRGFHALSGNRQFKFLLLFCLDGKILTFQITLCFYGIESLRGNIRAVC